MGDRCFLQMTYRKDDEPKWQEVFSVGKSPLDLHRWYDDVVESSENTFTIEVGEANYGWYEELLAASKLGCVFVGSHGAGGEYDAGEFCGVEGAYYEQEVNHAGEPTVRLDTRGNPLASEVIRARIFRRELKRATKALGI